MRDNNYVDVDNNSCLHAYIISPVRAGCTFILNVAGFVLAVAGVVLAVAGVILAVVCAFVLLNLVYVLMSSLFKCIMVHLIGTALYNESFPVCTDTKYLGNNCYTSTSTYCTYEQ
jgi:hypothetical protein